MPGFSRTPMSNPLLTFAVGAYNHENFIREAVAGAFARTYSPLEIILSDDCSHDRTFEIMQEMAAGYRGPHKIILNRNPTNLGICGHANRLFDLTNGEWLVGSAGDDASLPERTTTLFNACRASGNDVYSIYSDAIVIDANGNRTGNWFSTSWDVAKSLKEAISGKPIGVLGCTHTV